MNSFSLERSEIARASNTQLIAQCANNCDLVSEDEIAALGGIIQSYTQYSSGHVQFSVQITPATSGESPLDITISSLNTLALGNYQITDKRHQLISPDGSSHFWPQDELRLILTTPGIYRLLIDVSTSDPADPDITFVDTYERSIEVGQNATTPILTWGNEGSCSVETLTANIENICIESLDGSLDSLATQCTNTLNNLPNMPITSGNCPVSLPLNGGNLLGWCDTVELSDEGNKGVRVFHYENPLRPTTETFAQKQTREAARCISRSGSWTAAE